MITLRHLCSDTLLHTRIPENRLQKSIIFFEKSKSCRLRRFSRRFPFRLPQLNGRPLWGGGGDCLFPPNCDTAVLTTRRLIVVAVERTPGIRGSFHGYVGYAPSGSSCGVTVWRKQKPPVHHCCGSGLRFSECACQKARKGRIFI